MPDSVESEWDEWHAFDFPRFEREEPPEWFTSLNAYTQLNVPSERYNGTDRCQDVMDGLQCDRRSRHYDNHQASWDDGAFSLRWVRT